VYLGPADSASFTPILPFASMPPVCALLEQHSSSGDLAVLLDASQQCVDLKVEERLVLASPFEALLPFTKPEPQMQWPAVRERLRHVEKLHDLCEAYLEAVNVPAHEFNLQQGQLKICRIDLGGTVVEGVGDTWLRARCKAALEVMMRLDSGLMEDWLKSHKDYLLAHFAQA